jgi:hypothetical protein
LIIVYFKTEEGWSPIDHMVNLATEIFNANLILIDINTPHKIRTLEFLLGRQKNGEPCLLVSPTPSLLQNLCFVKNWRKRFGFFAVWVIDSFWTDRFPKVLKFRNIFDHMFIFTEEDIPAYREHFRSEVSWLPVGADVLRFGGVNTHSREIDLARIGRQPPDWQDDGLTKIECSELGMKFQGRIKGYSNALENQIALANLYTNTKYLLAFTNIKCPDIYTHPTRQYITCRWADALACGATIAGDSIFEASQKKLLWDGAILELDSVNRTEGLKVISSALETWTPNQVIFNYHMALKKLDWRWRFKTISQTMQLENATLDRELLKINNILNT